MVCLYGFVVFSDIEAYFFGLHFFLGCLRVFKFGNVGNGVWGLKFICFIFFSDCTNFEQSEKKSRVILFICVTLLLLLLHILLL